MLKFEDVAVHLPGNAPIVLCSHHDGLNAVAIDGTPLPSVRGRQNDRGTRELAFRTADVMRRTHSISPHLIIFNIVISRSTDEMFDLYIARVFAVICGCLNRFGKCAVVDIHRFYKHPELTADIRRQYDIWFGTDHGRSVRDDFDAKLAAEMIAIYRKICGREITIYVPGETEKIGERFGATGKDPIGATEKDRKRIILTKTVSDTFCGQKVSAVQAEFYKEILSEGAPMVKLAIAFANALAKAM